MKRIAMVVCYPLMWVTSLFAGNELWQRSVEAVDSNGLWIPGTVTMHEKILDNEGKTLEESDAVFELHPDGKQINVTVLEYQANSSTTEKKIQSEMIAEFTRELESFHADIPYQIADSTELIYEEKKDSKEIGGAVCQACQFKVTEGGKPSIGTVWLDPDNALPRIIEICQDNVNLNYGNYEVLHISRIIEFHAENGMWKKIKEKQSRWIQYNSYFKRHLQIRETTLEFKNHWKQDRS